MDFINLLQIEDDKSKIVKSSNTDGSKSPPSNIRPLKKIVKNIKSNISKPLTNSGDGAVIC